MLGSVGKVAGGKDVFRVSDLMVLVPEEIMGVSGGVVSLGRALVRAGAVRAGPVNIDGRATRLIAIRNIEYWRENTLDHAAWRENFKGKMSVARKRGRR